MAQVEIVPVLLVAPDTEAPPLNTTPGDARLIRAIIGDDATFDSLSTDGGTALDNRIIIVEASHAPSSNNTAVIVVDDVIAPDASAAGGGSHDILNVDFSIQPTAASAHRHRGMSFTLRHDAGAFDLTSVSAMTGMQARLFQEVAATTVNVMSALRANVGAVAGAITTAEGLGIYYGTAGDAGSIANEAGIRFKSNVIPAGGVTERYAIIIPDVSGTGIVDFAGLYIQTLSPADGLTFAIHVSDNIIRIGGDGPGGVDGAEGLTAISRTMPGLELASDHMNTTNQYTPAIKFMSTDGQFTTENPKFLAAIFGEAIETYNDDNDGGMYVNIAATEASPGATTTPTIALVVAGNGIRVPGYAKIGGAGSPTNSTAGDLTADRLNIARDGAAFGTSGELILVGGTVDNTAGGAAVVYAFTPSIAPTSASSTEFRTLLFGALLTPSTGVTMANIRGGYFELRNRSDAAISSLTSIFAAGLVIDSGSPATVGTISAVLSVDAIPYARPSGTSTVTVTTMYGVRVLSSGSAGLTVTNLYGLYISSAMAGATNYIGIEIEQITNGATLNIGIRNRSSYVATPSTAQTITAVGATILVDAETVQVNADASYTLTSTPTIADGDDGQIVTIVNVDSTDVITLQDESSLAGSNLRLPGAANVALGPRDVLRLQFIAALGDWVCIGQVNN